MATRAYLPHVRIYSSRRREDYFFRLHDLPEVIDASIEINVVAYVDGTVETTGSSEAKSTSDYLINGRKVGLKTTKEILALGQRILADSTNQHPATTMIHQLEAQSKDRPDLAEALQQFKKPEWPLGNNSEFVPENEGEYLQRYLKEQLVWVTELARNQLSIPPAKRLN